MILAYFGPETTVPMASVLAASLGFLMMMGRSSLRILAQVVRYARSRIRANSKRRVQPSHLAAGMRSDQPHRGGDVPAWARPNRAPGVSARADHAPGEKQSSNV